MRLFCISCEVLARPLYLCAARSSHIVDIELYRRGLHNDPADLRGKLQARIDALIGSNYDAITMGYGLCGQATAGLIARDIPLVIPRAHDCITLLLGSRQAYQADFDAHPGTYYLSPGWSERSDRSDDFNQRSTTGRMGLCRSREELVAEYGEENAEFIAQTLGDWNTAWIREYSRLCLIDSGVVEVERYQAQAQEMAGRNNWQLVTARGSLDLLQRLVDGDWSEDDFLVVPPGASLRASGDAAVIRLDRSRGGG